MEKIYLEWEVGSSAEETTFPEKFYEATVPGAVQLDWAKNEGITDYHYNDEYKKFLWCEDAYWRYRTTITKTAKEDERLLFISKGIDYRYKILLNSKEIYAYEGMFAPVELDVTSAKHGDTLEIIIYPIPKREGAPVAREQADDCAKPAVSYSWDFHPRLVPSGIWDETYLEIKQNTYIKSQTIETILNKTYDNATVLVNTQIEGDKNAQITFTLADKNGNIVLAEQGDKIDTTIANPQLWWCNGQGESYLYTATITVTLNGKIVDTLTKKVGFREVKLVMHDGAWARPMKHPMSCNDYPITMQLNGRKIFSKGTNLVPFEIFFGIIDEKRYRENLDLIKDANMNIVRIWGGGIINKSAFFDICDEYGIMVWQEFPLACNEYKDNAPYLNTLDLESKAIIKKLREHPSLAMWCGGNELFNSWSRMTNQHKALRLLDRNCYDLDENTPYMQTSPMPGMSHGCYLFLYYDGREVYEAMNAKESTAYTEFGVGGACSVEELKRFIPENELFPPKEGTAWEEHHAINAWVGPTWLTPNTIEKYFGASDNLEDLVEKSQTMQAAGYKCIFEEARRQKPRCSMALNWCFNEPWPNAANNSIVSYYGKPKKAYYEIKNSCRNTLASARLFHYQYKANETFEFEMFLLNDSFETVKDGTIKAVVEINGINYDVLTWDYKNVQNNENIKGPIGRFIMPDVDVDGIIQFKLKLICDDVSLNSEYTLSYVGNYKMDYKRMLNI